MFRVIYLDYFYGVFDFGLWRLADEKKERRFDYVTDHFDAGGDQYLGGENLLELLAFNVVKDNKNELLKENITLSKLVFCKEFLGSELILVNSEEAKLNMKLLKNELRPLIERTENMREYIAEGV